MKLFLLKRFRCDYDETSSCVIRAECEKDARELASKNYMRENSYRSPVSDDWLDKKLLVLKF